MERKKQQSKSWERKPALMNSITLTLDRSTTTDILLTDSRKLLTTDIIGGNNGL